MIPIESLEIQKPHRVEHSDVSQLVRIPLSHERVSVFISSTICELKAERKLADRVIRDELDLYPVRFELGAQRHPPKDVYRESLRRCNIVVAIYWESYGWVADDMEISGIHDELSLARKLDKPLLVYVKASDKRDPRLQAIIEEISSEVTYTTFNTLEEFEEKLKGDLARELSRGYMMGSIGNSEEEFGPRLDTPDLLPELRDNMVRHYAMPRPVVLREIVDQLDCERRLLLVGPPGVGKTFILGNLAEKFSGIYVSLSKRTTQQVMQHLTNRLRGIRGEAPQRYSGETDARQALQAELSVSDQVLLIDHADQNLETAAALSGLSIFNCKMIFATRVPRIDTFGSVPRYQVPSFTPLETQEYLTLRGLDLGPSETEALINISAGNPLYLYYFSTKQISPLPQGLTEYQDTLYKGLSSDERHVLNLIAVSLQPLQHADLYSLLAADGTITGPPTVIQDLLTNLEPLINSDEDALVVFHPYFQEFVITLLKHQALLTHYHGMLATFAISNNWVLPAAYHLNRSGDPRQLEYLPQGVIVAKLHGSWKIAEQLNKSLIEIARTENHTGLLAESKMHLSELYSSMGRHSEARTEVSEAIAIAKKEHLGEDLVVLEIWSATLHVDNNQPEEAIHILRRLLDEHDASDLHLSAGILFNLSFAYIRSYQWRLGAEAAELARTIFLDIGLEDSSYRSLINLCGCLLELGDYLRASEFLLELLDWSESKGYLREEAAALNLLAKLGRQTGKTTEAINHSRRAIRVWQKLGVPEKIAMNLLNLGNAYKESENLVAAESSYSEALTLAVDEELINEHGRALELLSALRLIQGETDEAASLAEEALVIHKQIPDPLRIAETLAKLGNIYQTQNQLNKARMCFAEAADQFLEIGFWGRAAASFEWSINAAAQNSPEEVNDLVNRGVDAALRSEDALQVFNVLQAGRDSADKSEAFRAALEKVLSTDEVPGLTHFLVEFVSHVSQLPVDEHSSLLEWLVERLFATSSATAAWRALNGLAIALLLTGDTIPDSIVEDICTRAQAMPSVYYRTYFDHAVIWTLRLGEDSPIILQIDVLSEEPFQARIGLALVLLLVANQECLVVEIGKLGKNDATELRLIAITESEFKSDYMIGDDSQFGVQLSHESPAYFARLLDDEGQLKPAMWIITHDKIQALSDFTGGVPMPAAQILIGDFFGNLIEYFTDSKSSNPAAKDVVVEIFKEIFN